MSAIYLSFAYPFPDVADLMDILHISRSSAVHPTSQTLAPSSPPHPSANISLAFLCFAGLSLLVLNSPVFGVFLYVRNNLIFAF